MLRFLTRRNNWAVLLLFATWLWLLLGYGGHFRFLTRTDIGTDQEQHPVYKAWGLETADCPDKQNVPPAAPQQEEKAETKPLEKRVNTALETQDKKVNAALETPKEKVNVALETQKEKVKPALETQQKKADTDVSPELMELYLKRLKGLHVKREHLKNNSCPNDLAHGGYPCRDPNCTATFRSPRDRLRTMLQSQFPVKEQYQQLTNNLADKTMPRVNLIFITAASANHYNESQGLLKTLFEDVFPFLAKHVRLTYRLVYYDLGLSSQQLQQLQSRSSSVLEVVRFPFESLPANFRKLGTCIWKPVLVKAHLRHSDATFWVDASARFTTANITSVLDHVNTFGVAITRTFNRLPMHVAEAMLQYFRIEPCILSAFYELAGGFLGFKNEQLVHRAIVDPWLSCAFSPDCACPGEDCWKLYGGCNNPNKTYSRCHRFDQSAMGVILDSLFDWRATQFVLSTSVLAFKRGDRIAYLPKV